MDWDGHLSTVAFPDNAAPYLLNKSTEVFDGPFGSMIKIGDYLHLALYDDYAIFDVSDPSQLVRQNITITPNDDDYSDDDQHYQHDMEDAANKYTLSKGWDSGIMVRDYSKGEGLYPSFVGYLGLNEDIWFNAVEFENGIAYGSGEGGVIAYEVKIDGESLDTESPINPPTESSKDENMDWVWGLLGGLGGAISFLGTIYLMGNYVNNEYSLTPNPRVEEIEPEGDIEMGNVGPDTEPRGGRSVDMSIIKKYSKPLREMVDTEDGIVHDDSNDISFNKKTPDNSLRTPVKSVMDLNSAVNLNGIDLALFSDSEEEKSDFDDTQSEGSLNQYKELFKRSPISLQQGLSRSVFPSLNRERSSKSDSDDTDSILSISDIGIDFESDVVSEEPSPVSKKEGYRRRLQDRALQLRAVKQTQSSSDPIEGYLPKR
ncbi:hypothetical protein HOH87_03245 [bacterium]|jgi:hypothetical protein|nr:hypothetical protein [bacterium]